jgi:hypothetical protein
MKLKSYISLITLVTAFAFFSTSNASGENNHSKYKKDNKKNYSNNDKNDNKQNDNHQEYNNNDRKDNRNDNVIKKSIIVKSPVYSYKYRGQYRNFRNYNHTNRYFYRGSYYDFDDYYSRYSRENNVFTYEGSYGRRGNLFIFSDRYGNEFDLYLKPMNRAPIWVKVAPLRVGNPYRLRIKPARYYPSSDEMRVGINLQFSWGNLTLQNNKYYDMHTAPELINIRGRIYRKL